MAIPHNKQKLFKRSIIASFAAMYVGVSGYAAADIGFTKATGSPLYEPTFTAEDVLSIQPERHENTENSLFSDYEAQANQVNRVKKQRSPTRIFQPEEGITGKHIYIVQLEERPVATYEGSHKKFTATAAPINRSLMAKGRVSMNTQSVQTYQNFLLNEQTSFMQQARSSGVNADIKQQYTVASNGMAVEMTQEDAILMSQQPGVNRITKERIFQLNSDRGAEFIEADKLWAGEVPGNTLAVQGEGMVVGVIDTGINTDHPSFASDEQFTAQRGEMAGVFFGDCVEDPTLCNDKLIGVRSYPFITSMFNASEFQERPWYKDFIRPQNGEDYIGHGSHTASTAAGNIIENVPLQVSDGSATSDGINVPFTFPKIGGVAPRAHIIAYSVCFPGGYGDPYSGCPESTILAAYEDAIADGVDVINFSIGGGESFPWEDPMELAFLAARRAGISVAASAGNSGPAYYSADHTSPWVTTVGASSHDRRLEVGVKNVTGFSDNSTSSNWRLPKKDIAGLSYSGAISGKLVHAANYPDPDLSDDFGPELCNAPFPAGTFQADEIVMCDRGDIARVDKAVNAAAGGAGGFILRNVDYSINSVVADSYVIPGIHVNYNDGRTLDWWLKYSSTATEFLVDITAGENNYELADEFGNNLAIFSSMGPARTTNTLVPDLTAPGVAVYAANADDQPFTFNPRSSDYTFMSGTSMASPHVTGTMALLQQMHPEWTPAEIQSALMMTAQPVMLDMGYALVPTFYHFMAGAGAINANQAAQAGLVMDETYDGYMDANPAQGGRDNWVNLPSMVDMDCEGTCSFMRTVTATQDGTWNAEGVVDLDSRWDKDVKVQVSPSQFTLAKGETQALIVKVTVPSIMEMKVDPVEPGAPWEAVAGNHALYNAMLELTEVNNAAPSAHMPIVVAGVYNQLPFNEEFDISSDSGSTAFRVNTDNYSEFTPTYYGLVTPVTEEKTVEMTRPFIGDDYINQETYGFVSIEIPAGTKRFMVSATEAKMAVDSVKDMNPMSPRYYRDMTSVMVGRDYNGNGSFIPTDEQRQEAIDTYGYEGASWHTQLNKESICTSLSKAEENFCSIIDPIPGTYWIATPSYDERRRGEGVMVKSTVRYAIIGADSSEENFTITGPESHDGNGDYNLTFNWDMPDAKEGDVFYGGFELGNMPGAEGTLGFTALNVVRGADTLSWNIDKTGAKNMDLVDVSFKVRPNLDYNDRNVDFKVTVPAGMRIVPETIKTNHNYLADMITADETSFMLSGTQESTVRVEREYVVTTNDTDEMCHTPLIDEYSTGGYINLQGEFRIQPNAPWLVGDYKTQPQVPIDWLFYMNGAEFKMYNQENGGQMQMHTVGVFQLNDIYWSKRMPRGPGFLFESLAPFWRGEFEMTYKRHWEDPEGLTLASQYASDRPDLGNLVFMEFDNVKDKYTGDTYDYEMILRSGMDYNPGMPEIIYAYDNLGANLARGSVHIEGFEGPISVGGGIKNGQLGELFGYDNLDEVLHDDLVICYNYQGPEQSEMEVSFKAVIQPEAQGSTLDMTIEYGVEGQPTKTATHSIEVKGNIKVAELVDMEVAENGRIDDIEVFHVDANNVSNELVVSGDNFTTEVDGMMFNIIPDAHFHGETVVTVTVQDTEHASDAASTDFLLTVLSDGIELGCTDTAATNFDANATADDASCTYPAEVVEPKSSSGGGSFGWLLLMLVPFAVRRKL